MSGDQLMGLVLLGLPALACLWAWIQWQREEARRGVAASEELRARAAAGVDDG